MKSKLIEFFLLSFVLLVVVVTGGAGWYYFFGSKPKVALSVPVSGKGGGVLDARVIGSRDLVLVVDGQVHHYIGLREKWLKPLKPDSTPDQYRQELQRINERFAKLRTWSDTLNKQRTSLKTPQEIQAFNAEAAKYHNELRSAQTDDARVRAALAGNHADGAAKTDPENSPYAWGGRGSLRHAIFASADSIWVIAARNAVQFNRQTGEHLKEIALPGEPEYAEQSQENLFVVARAEDQTKHLILITMKDGAAQQLIVPGDSLPVAQDYRSSLFTEVVQHRSQFVASSGLVQMDADLVEKKVTERSAMKPVNANPQSTSKTGWGDGAAEVTKMMADDAQREATGGVDRIDQSRYAVALRRDFVQPAVPEWKGEVTGRPTLYHAKTVDLIIADRQLYVFDCNNHQKWAAQLTYPIKLPMQKDPENCCLEVGNTLYVWDSGFLTAFQLGDGQVRWRIPSVGIRGVDQGDDGMLYVSTANRSAETLTYTQQSTIGDAVNPLLLKVDAAKGDVLWRAEGFEQTYVSGRYVYGTRSPVNPNDVIDSAFTKKSVQQRFLLYKLRRNSGKNDWNFFEPRIPEKIEADGRDVLMVFPNGIDVVTSWAF